MTTKTEMKLIENKLEVYPSDTHFKIFDGDNEIAKVYDEEKAAHIVKCVNNFDGLLEAAKEAVRHMNALFNEDQNKAFVNGQIAFKSIALQNLEKAITQAQS